MSASRSYAVAGQAEAPPASAASSAATRSRVAWPSISEFRSALIGPPARRSTPRRLRAPSTARPTRAGWSATLPSRSPGARVATHSRRPSPAPRRSFPHLFVTAWLKNRDRFGAGSPRVVHLFHRAPGATFLREASPRVGASDLSLKPSSDPSIVFMNNNERRRLPQREGDPGPTL